MSESEQHMFRPLLHLSSVSEKTLDDILKTLWSTRRKGINAEKKERIKRLIDIDDEKKLNLILACLRLIIRKCVHDKINTDEIKNLLPDDISSQFRTIFVSLLNKFRNRWIEEASKDEPIVVQRSMPLHVKVNSFHALPSFAARELSLSMWERKDVKDGNSGVTGESSMNSDALAASESISEDTVSGGYLDRLPQLKSMTWTMQTRNNIPSKRVAVITLKLQDYSKSPNGEMEVKFQITKDTLESLLQSLTCISEQLSSSVALPSVEPSPKKHRQD